MASDISSSWKDDGPPSNEEEFVNESNGPNSDPHPALIAIGDNEPTDESQRKAQNLVNVLHEIVEEVEP